MDDRPLSELISSEPPMEMPESMEAVPEQKKSKAFIIVVSILLLLIFGVGGYFVYTQYFAPVEEEEEVVQEEEPFVDEITIGIETEKSILVKLETSECDDTGYEEIEKEIGFTVWEDNQNMFCSSSYILTYFESLDDMSKYFAELEEVPTLEKVIVDGIEYEYIKRVEGIEQDESIGMGLAYNWEPEVEVKDYSASRIISYYNNTLTTSDLGESSSITSYCVFDLTQIGDDYEGYLVFNGVASAGSELNYCEVLNDMSVFEISEI